ncbi:MAG: type IV secretion system protein [Coriobacteriaceae bacterium]|nr:type IV secretion system protein [Coriobacteriaceae bacterium]
MNSAALARARTENLAYAKEGFYESLKRRAMSIRESARAYPHRIASVLFIVTLAIALLIPTFAFGGILEKAANSLIRGANDNITKAVNDIKDLTADEKITADFNKIFGAPKKGKPSISGSITKISNKIIKPCATSILAIILYLQLLKIVRRFDQGSGTMPAAKEVFVLLTVCVFLMLLVQNADKIVKSIYELILLIIKSITNTLGDPSAVSDIKVAPIPDSGANLDDLGQALGVYFIAFLLRLFSLLTIVACKLAVIGRGLTIYLLTAFAPIPLSLMGFEETKSWSISYLRTFMVECLAAAVLVISLWCAPLIMSTVIKGDIDAMNPVTFCELAACIWLTFTMCNKSGQIAGKILGQG